MSVGRALAAALQPCFLDGSPQPSISPIWAMLRWISSGVRSSLWGGDRPAMAERIHHLAVAVAPEHVRRRHGDLRARRHRLLDRGIHILHVQVQRHRRALERLGPQAAPFGEVIHQHHHRIADADRGVHHFAAGSRQARQFLGVERLAVEGNRIRGAFAHDVRGQGVHAVGNRFLCGGGHDVSPKTGKGMGYLGTGRGGACAFRSVLFLRRMDGAGIDRPPRLFFNRGPICPPGC